MDGKLTITLSLGFSFVYSGPEIERSPIPLKKEGKPYAKHLVFKYAPSIIQQLPWASMV